MKRRFLTDRKGLHTVVGAIFFVLIVLTFATGTFLWTLTQNISYNQGVLESNRIDQDRLIEKIKVDACNYTVLSNNMVQVNTTLINEGPVATQFVNLWVYDSTMETYGFNDTIDETLSVNLKPGEEKRLVATVVVDKANNYHTFSSWFITARGNLIPLEAQEVQMVVIADVAKGVGAMALEFDEFRHFTYESSQKLGDYPNGTLGFNMPKNTYIAVGCYLTNLDPSEQMITIDSHSLFWQPGRSGVSESNWFIVNVSPNGTIADNFSQISIDYGETKRLVFASSKDLGIGSFARQATPNVETTVGTFILLHGTLGSKGYAQNIPFVSIFIS